MRAFEWQKPSYSTEGANCVNIAAGPDGLLWLRESTEPEEILTVGSGCFRGLLTAIKKDRLPLRGAQR
ncbi:hypothetical protein SUDANB171_01324 [Streptomyces sp. enrichment culture]|uniref:DUF397 domain-containing protein n=1 Tax=Streptomyces sp. enrichment culture TaxID=1795815 RepID=UPI003F5605D3